MWVWARLFVGVLALVFVSKWWSRVEGVGGVSEEWMTVHAIWCSETMFNRRFSWFYSVFTGGGGGGVAGGGGKGREDLKQEWLCVSVRKHHVLS